MKALQITNQIRDVVDDDEAVGAAVVAGSDCAEALLAGSIPLCVKERGGGEETSITATCNRCNDLMNQRRR